VAEAPTIATDFGVNKPLRTFRSTLIPPARNMIVFDSTGKNHE
jgi:hypothetical protein